MTSLVDSAQTARARPRVSLPMLKPHRSIGALPLEAARRWRQGERLSRRGRDALGLAVERRVDAPTWHREREREAQGKKTHRSRTPWARPRASRRRIDTANRGKKMLDEGGPDVELKLGQAPV